jgi:hypothetical protein
MPDDDDAQPVHDTSETAQPRDPSDDPGQAHVTGERQAHENQENDPPA